MGLCFFSFYGTYYNIGMNGHRYPHYKLVPNGLNGYVHVPNIRHNKLVTASSLSTLHQVTSIHENANHVPKLPRLFSTNWTPNITPTYRDFSSS